MTGRSQWKLAILTAALVIPMVLGAIGVSAQGRAYLSGQLPRLSPVFASRTGEPLAAEAMPSRSTVRSNDARPLAPRFDEFTIRTVVNGVSAPPGTGLPGIESVEINPESALPLIVNLRVAGADNPAWKQLTYEDQDQYAREVLAALVATYREVETHLARERVYFAVQIWDDFLATTPPDSGNLDSPFICKRVPDEESLLRCTGTGIGEIAPVPAQHRE